MSDVSFIAVLSELANIQVFAAILGGSVLGIVIGALPGIGPATAMAVMLPLTFKLPPLISVAFLGSLWASGIYGGSWSAILINVPGTSMSVATALDGFPMAQQGRALEALGAATMSSFLGGLAGVLILIVTAPLIIDFIVRVGPPEFVWINILALVVIAATFQGSMLKGIVAGLFGLSLSLIGIDAVVGVPRYTFGTLYLQDGFSLVPVMIGIFGFGEVISMLQKPGTISKAGRLGGNLFTGFRSVLVHPKTVLLGTVIGSIIGVIPGTGGSAANLIAYSEAKRRSKDPQSFGKGNVEGVIASESSNNAIEGTALVPALTLGIPGSASAAILITALLLQGFTPGRLLFEGKTFVWAFFACLILAQFSMLIVGLSMMRVLSYVTLIRKEILACAIIALCCIGVYSYQSDLRDVLVAVVFGVIGYALRKNEFPIVGLIVGLILGRATESAFTQTLAISGGTYTIFFTRPLCIVFILLIGMLIFMRFRIRGSG